MTGDSLDNLLEFLSRTGYRFLCPTPESHSRYLKTLSNNQQTPAASLTDVFGWSLPLKDLDLKSLSNGELDCANTEEILEIDSDAGVKRPKIRLSTLNLKGAVSPLRSDSDMLYLHSAYPCTDKNGGAFFGPDTYRFVKLLSSSTVIDLVHSLQSRRTAIDLCCGAGAGALALSKLYEFDQVIGLDINTTAIKFAQVNARTAKSPAVFRQSDFFASLGQKDRNTIDVVLCNPPYIPSSKSTSVYCDGGQDGIVFSLKAIHESLNVLQRDGLLVLYTGVCFNGQNPGNDILLQACNKLAKDGLVEIIMYEIIDNDVFGEEVSIVKDLGYIMVVGCVLKKL